MSVTATPSRSSHLVRLTLAVLGLPLLGALGFAALWALFGLFRGHLPTWPALLAALDLLLMVRLARLPRGAMRGAVAMLGVLLCIVLAHWLYLGVLVGSLLGMPPLLGVSLMRPGFAWTLFTLLGNAADLAALLAALAIAAWFGR
ncbi:hypothetical protein [Luteimonas sp. e5]